MARFATHAGTGSGSERFPGWFRSLTYAAQYARAGHFDKVVHIESDSFLISRRIQAYVNSIGEGWTALWCPRHNAPESCIQIIAGESLKTFFDFAQQPYSDFFGDIIEKRLPFTRIEKSFIGDRYGEYRPDVPGYADYVAQTRQSPEIGPDYFWWLRDEETPQEPLEASIYAKPVLDRAEHTGEHYLGFLAALSNVLQPTSYFEIGTESGQSVRHFTCPSVCVDPHFNLREVPIGSKEHLSLMQMTSDEFFGKFGLRRFFPAGPDVAFLDGLHLFEVLLRDFINTEKECHGGSLVLLHDCLPTNSRMAQREFIVDPTEATETRGFWAGDVWRLLPAFKKYRPDLRIFYLDCPPTGLVACNNLDPSSRVLQDHYSEIVAEFSERVLDPLTLLDIWTLYPTIDTRKLLSNRSRWHELFCPP